MNPNSISHRLFAAALSQDAQAVAKRSGREVSKDETKSTAAHPARVSSAAGATSRKLSAWSWSGWQQTTI
jgi:hypothetical protein